MRVISNEAWGCRGYKRRFRLKRKRQTRVLIRLTLQSKEKSEGGKTFQMSTVNLAQLRSVATGALRTCPAKSISCLLRRDPHFHWILGNLSISLCRWLPLPSSTVGMWESRQLSLPLGWCLGIPQVKVWEFAMSRSEFFSDLDDSKVTQPWFLHCFDLDEHRAEEMTL